MKNTTDSQSPALSPCNEQEIIGTGAKTFVPPTQSETIKRGAEK